MADIEGNYHCCHDCAVLIANGDSSAMDLYADEYRAVWEAGMIRAAVSLPEGVPVVESCSHADEDAEGEFMCDYCLRNVYSFKHRLTFSS